MSGLCAQSRDAALVICGRAADDAEARMLLGMCGLLDGDPLLGVALLSPRSCPGCGLPITRSKPDSEMCQRCINQVDRTGSLETRAGSYVADSLGRPAVASASVRSARSHRRLRATRSP